MRTCAPLSGLQDPNIATYALVAKLVGSRGYAPRTSPLSVERSATELNAIMLNWRAWRDSNPR